MFLVNRSHAVKNGGRNGIHHRWRAPKQYESVNNILMNILVTRIYFILTITWSLAHGCGQQRNRRDKKCRRIDVNFDSHGDAAVRRGAHRPMKHIRSFTRSHWMPPLGECLCRIAPAAAMVNEFVETTQYTNNTQLLPCNYSTFRALVNSENFIPQNGPSTQVIDATSFV